MDGQCLEILLTCRMGCMVGSTLAHVLTINFLLFTICRGHTYTSTLKSGVKEGKKVLHLSIGTWRTRISLNHEK